MSTMDYTKMTTKKLTSMYAKANEEEKAAIAAELANREAAQKPAVQGQAEGQEYNDPDYTPTPEDEKAWAEAEKNGGKVGVKVRRTEEELALLADQLKPNIGHRCKTVVPALGPELLEGTIIAVVANKAAAQAFYTIKLDNGKKTAKAWDSPLITILEETVEVGVKPRKNADKTPWTEEELASLVAEASVNVGKVITLEDGQVGRIVTIVPDKRSKSILYSINIFQDKDGYDMTGKAYRVNTSKGIVIAEELDEEGQALNEKYLARKAKASEKKEVVPVDPKEKLVKAEDLLKKAQDALAKAQELVAKRLKAVEDAKAAVAAMPEKSAETSEATEATKATEAQESDNDLM